MATHNFGVVASIAVVVFLAGEERSADPNSLFAIHGARTSFKSEERHDIHSLGESLGRMLGDQRLMAGVIAERMEIDIRNVKRMLVQGRIFSPGEAVKAGIIKSIKPLLIEKELLKIVL